MSNNQDTIIRNIAVRKIFPTLNKYVNWACESGLYLPPDYSKDPTGWNEVMRKIQRAFRLLSEELDEYGQLWEAKNKWKKFGEQDNEEIQALEKEIQEGLALFGKYLFYLTDVIIDRGPTH